MVNPNFDFGSFESSNSSRFNFQTTPYCIDFLRFLGTLLWLKFAVFEWSQIITKMVISCRYLRIRFYTTYSVRDIVCSFPSFETFPTLNLSLVYSVFQPFSFSIPKFSLEMIFILIYTFTAYTYGCGSMKNARQFPCTS